MKNEKEIKELAKEMSKLLKEYLKTEREIISALGDNVKHEALFNYLKATIVLSNFDKIIEESETRYEKCQNCGKRYKTVYRVSDEIWELIKPPFKEKGTGLLCLSCAEAIAKLNNVDVYWEGTIGDFPSKIGKEK